MPYLTGDSSITPRIVLTEGWSLLIRCGNPKCRRSTGPALRMHPWPRVYDVPIVALYDKLRCSHLVERRGRMVKCGGRTVEVTVTRFNGKGSQTEEVLKLAEKIE